MPNGFNGVNVQNLLLPLVNVENAVKSAIASPAQAFGAPAPPDLPGPANVLLASLTGQQLPVPSFQQIFGRGLFGGTTSDPVVTPAALRTRTPAPAPAQRLQRTAVFARTGLG